MVVVGAGVIGMEYASMFAALGTKVTVVERRDRMLEFCDEEVVEALKYHLRDLAVMGCGGTVDYLVDAVFNYPTLAESYKVAALDATNKMRAVTRLSN
jgi:pyruvate/2-oxoglutarate dehydrogenase complex dihydrolipoamide dehydrogenase (E3) component